MGLTEKMKLGVVIAAAGAGKRMGSSTKKQFLCLKDKPILLHTLEQFIDFPGVQEIVIVTGAEDMEMTRNLVQSYPSVLVVPGGKERQDSVYAGLKSLRTSEYVLIHDGARPFISHSAIQRLVDRLAEKQSAILAVPVKDTIKQVNNQGSVVNTPPRESLWAVQTPQAFHIPLIMRAYLHAEEQGFYGTDDASLVEFYGEEVSVVLGEYTNIKITTPEDLWIGEMILQNKEGEGIHR
jgi:2-C-methyl-D-erythritol 4-phosphate cytidylyltransferase